MGALACQAHGIITTYAGTGSNGFSGDGGAAVSASLNYPNGLSVDPSGNLYIADGFNHRVRKITGGVISTVAGNGTQACASAAGINAVEAPLNYPYGVAAYGGTDNITYFSDSQNHRLMVIWYGLSLYDLAGMCSMGNTGDGSLATSAKLKYPRGFAGWGGYTYIADSGNFRIRRFKRDFNMEAFAGIGVPGFAGDGGPASDAQFQYPTGLAFDGSGNLYISDSGDNRIRRVDTGGNISTFAGTGASGYSGDAGPATSASLNGPSEMAFDGTGNLYFSDTLNHCVRKITPGGTITTVVGTGSYGFSGDKGLAADAQLFRPVGLAFDASGNLYISDSYNSRIRKVTP
jgi:sugar lactone lactonase YvrE